MTTSHQYDLFEDVAISQLREELKESIRKTQKNLFAKHGDVVKMLLELLYRVEQLEGKNENNTI